VHGHPAGVGLVEHGRQHLRPLDTGDLDAVLRAVGEPLRAVGHLGVGRRETLPGQEVPELLHAHHLVVDRRLLADC